MQINDDQAWSQRLEKVFTHDGRVGGRTLPSLNEQERICGAYSRDPKPDYRILADSFIDFFATTLGLVSSAYHEKGWPDDPCYGLCVIEFVAQFRGFRTAEILAENGYLFDGYARLRALKNQALDLGAIIGGVSSFPALYGCEVELTARRWDELAQTDSLCRSVEEQRVVASRMLGGTSGLDAATVAALAQWTELFDLKMRGARSVMALEMKAWSENKAHFSVGPRIDSETASLYTRRFVEVAWMTLRTLPFLQNDKGTFTDTWCQHWRLLDQSMRLAVEAAATRSGEPTVAAFLTLIDAKFPATPAMRYAERGQPGSEGIV